MKKLLKILGIILGVVLGIILIVAAWVQFSGMPTYEAKELPVTIKTDSATLANGHKLVVQICTHCHLSDDGKLGGKAMYSSDSPFGSIYSRNITHHPTKGTMSKYTDGQLAYLFRTGIGPQGQFVGPYMAFPLMSDEDVASIIAYMRSDAEIMQPSENDPPKTSFTFLAKALIKFGAFKPFEYKGEPITAPPASDQIAYGRYLATAKYICSDCHSASFETNNPFEPEKSPGYFAGGNLIEHDDVKTLSANITMSKTTGIGNWTYEQFAHAVRTGQRPDQKILSTAMPRFALLDDAEISAIWAYLQTVPTQENDIATLAAQQK